MHTIGQIDNGKRGFDVLAAIGFRELGQQQRKLDVLKRREHRNEVVHLKNKTDVAGTPLGEFAA